MNLHYDDHELENMLTQLNYEKRQEMMAISYFDLLDYMNKKEYEEMVSAPLTTLKKAQQTKEI